MRFIRKFRRGQIRGIDFSLAMIIFLLTMSQVLVLTSTFIENAQESQGLNGDLSLTQTYVNDILYSPGISGTDYDWHDVQTASLTNWKFGLGNGNGTIDSYKLGRLANNSESNYLLSYSDIRAATNYELDFEIRFRTTINVQITTASIAGTDLDLTAQVSKSGRTLSNAFANVYVVDASNNIDTANSVTSSDGALSFSVPLTDSGSSFHIAIIMVQYGVGNFDVDYQIVNGSPNQVGQTLTKASGNGYTVNADVGSGTFDFTALSMGSGANITAGVTASTSNSNIPIPQDGMVVIIANSGSSFALSTFPLIIDDYLFSSIEPSTPNGSQSTAVERLVNVRGVFLEFSFITWS